MLTLRLCVEDVFIPSGHMLVYSPQPMDAKYIDLQTFPLTTPPDDTTESDDWDVRIPADSIDSCLWFWWFDFHGRTQSNQVCESRQGVAKLDSPRTIAVGEKITVTIKRPGGLTINTVTFRVTWRSSPPPDPSTLPVATVSRSTTKVDKRILSSIMQAQDFYSHVNQKVAHLLEWQVGHQEFPVGPMPPWAFLIQPNEPRRVQDQIPSLLRLLQVAAHRLRVPSDVLSDPDKWPLPLRCELMCEMATFLALAAAYRLDTRVSYGNDPLDRESIDQWIHPLIMPRLDEAGFDCEDAVSVMVTVFRLLQEIVPPDNWSSGPTWLASGLRSVCALACRYVVFMVIGSLRLGHDDFTYHAYSIAVDRNRVMAAVADSKQPKAKQMEVLPLLTLEGTEYTTSCLDYTQGPSKEVFTRLDMSNLCAHAKIPASMIRGGPQYHEMVTLFAPQLWQTTGVCEWAVIGKNGVNGVDHKLFREWGSARKASNAIKLQPVSHVNPKQMAAVRKRASLLPHADGIPPVLPNAFGFVHSGDRKMVPDTLTYFGRPMDLMDKRRQQDINTAIRTYMPDMPETTFTRLAVLRGVSIVRVDTPIGPPPQMQPNQTDEQNTV